MFGRGGSSGKAMSYTLLLKATRQYIKMYYLITIIKLCTISKEQL